MRRSTFCLRPVRMPLRRLQPAEGSFLRADQPGEDGKTGGQGRLGDSGLWGSSGKASSPERNRSPGGAELDQ